MEWTWIIRVCQILRGEACGNELHKLVQTDPSVRSPVCLFFITVSPVIFHSLCLSLSCFHQQLPLEGYLRLFKDSIHSSHNPFLMLHFSLLEFLPIQKIVQSLPFTERYTFLFTSVVLVSIQQTNLFCDDVHLQIALAS